MSSNKKFITTIFDIFGYSLIGIMAYCFGLILQNYNEHGKLLVQLTIYGDLTSSIFLLICFQFLFTCLFGFSYAKVFFYKAEANIKNDNSENFKEIFKITGNWIEVILFCLMIATFVYWINNPNRNIKPTFWYATVFSGTPYIISSMVYRIKSKGMKNKKGKKNTQNRLKETKYVLVCPAILMIGVNIYLGSSILSLLKGDVIYYYPMIIFSLFFVAFYISKKPKNDTILYIMFSIILIIVGILSYNKYLSLPSRNMFLSIMTSIFMAIFESWYIAFRQLEGVKNRNFVKVTSYIVTSAPLIVFALYPIQDFGIIYFISFWLGMIVTQFLWFFYIYPNAKSMKPNKNLQLRKNTGILRATLGILVLVFLALDKHFGTLKTQHQILDNTNSAIDYNTFLAAIATLIAFIPMFTATAIGSWSNEKNTTNNTSFLKKITQADVLTLYRCRLGAYTVIAYILWGERRFLKDIDIYKQDLNFYGYFLFVVIDLVTVYLLSKKTKSIKQTKEKNDA